MVRRRHLAASRAVVLSILCTVFVTAAFTRVRTNINELSWKFYKGDVAGASQALFDDNAWMDVTLPHDFNGGIDGKNFDVFKGRFNFGVDNNERMMYKGPGWYRARFTIDPQYEGKRIFLEFEAVTLVADVYLNGTHVGQHRGGYTAFKFDITDIVKFGSENLLAVKADNSNRNTVAPWMANEKEAFPYSFDYAIYGGIYRDVWLEISDNVKIEAVYNTPNTAAAAPTNVSIRTEVKNYSATNQTVRLQTSIVNPKNVEVKSLSVEKAIEAGASYTFEQTADGLGTTMYWSPEAPNLYKVKTVVSVSGEERDQCESVFGIRYFTLANGQAFYLNDQKMLIRGVNRHQDMAGKGYALSNEQHFEDVRILKEAGFNFIRHAHYPCDREFTRACDELGMMLWLEIPYTGSTSDQDSFKTNCLDQLREMILQNYNNPSVIIWGLGNESDRSGPGYASQVHSNAINTELNALAHTLDEKRLTTACNLQFASNQSKVDIYSPQDWQGWYGGVIKGYNPTQLIGEYGADMHNPFHSEEKFTADYADGNGNPDYWCQEFGCVLHEYKASFGLENVDKFPGHFVWVGFDFASPRNGRQVNPIPFMNQKGLLLHDHRTKKDVYYFYQSFYRQPEDYPMVYIASKSWKDRWTEPAAKTVWAYSNCDSVKLFNDWGQTTLGTRTRNAGPRGDTRFEWADAFVKYNVLYAEGYYKGQVAARDTLLLENLDVVPVKHRDAPDVLARLSAAVRPRLGGGAMFTLQLRQAAEVQLALFSVRGEKVRELSRGRLEAGTHSFALDQREAASGLYFVRVAVDGWKDVQKVILR